MAEKLKKICFLSSRHTVLTINCRRDGSTSLAGESCEPLDDVSVFSITDSVLRR